MHSVTIAGKDVTERAFDLQADTTSIVVTFTDQPSKVSGAVKDARERPARPRWCWRFRSIHNDGQVRVYPRALQSASTTRSGDYTFSHLPAGDYYVIAIDPAGFDGWKDPRRLKALASRATKLSASAGDAPKTVDLTVQVVR